MEKERGEAPRESPPGGEGLVWGNGGLGVLEPAARGGNAESGVITDFLVRLSVASRSRSFYPPDHPAVKESLMVLQELASYIYRDLRAVTLEVRSDGFYLEGRELARGKEGVRKLCGKLRAMNVSSITINFDFTLKDIQAVVDLLGQDPMVVMASGGAQEFLKEREVETFFLKESRLCPDAEEGSPGWPGEEGAVPSTMAWKDGKKGRKHEAELELDILGWELFDIPRQGADALMWIWSVDPSDPRAKASRILESIDAEISRFVSERGDGKDLEAFLRHLGEALLFLDSGVRDQLLAYLLGPRGRKFEWFAGLLTSFTERELIDLLGGMIFNLPEMMDPVRDFLSRMYGEAGSRSLMRGLRDKILDLGAPSELAEGFLPFEPLERPPGREDLLEVMRERRLPEVEGPERGMDRFDLWHEALEEFPPLLLSLLEKGEIVENMEMVAGWVRQILACLVDEGELEKAADLVGGFQDIVFLGNLPPKVEAFLEETLSELSSVGSLKTLVNSSFYRSEDKGAEAERLACLVARLGEGALRNLVEILAKEEKVGIRKFICEVLMRAGSGNVHLLGSYVMDERWYLARNIVYVLGRTGNSSSLAYLKMAMKHPHPKVRREALVALGQVGSPEALEELVKAIRHEDPSTRVQAVRCLERIGGEVAEEVLLGILERGLGKRPDEVLLEEAVSALVRMRCHKAYPALAALANAGAGVVVCDERRIVGRKKWERIAVLAREGMMELETAFPRVGDGEVGGRRADAE
jgi:hypothetical protein